MKKSSFVAMIIACASGMMFVLGMCMVLLPEWNAFSQGVLLGSIGLLLACIGIHVWRVMEQKQPIHYSKKFIVCMIVAILGALLFGTGMCFSMVYHQMLFGIALGLLGIIILLSLVPLVKGVK